MIRINLHKMFNQFHHNFEIFCRIESKTIRQNKLKQLEATYRRFQAECITLNHSVLRKENYSSLESIFDEEDPNVKDGKQPLIKVLVQGLINQTLNEAVRLQKKFSGMQKIKLSEKNLKKKQNPYWLREQSFFANQVRKQKIDMKKFIN